MASRRGFLSALGIALAAPAIVRAESLMRIAVPKQDIIVPAKDLWLPKTGGWMQVAYAKGAFIALDMKSGFAATSNDGITWSPKRPATIEPGLSW